MLIVLSLFGVCKTIDNMSAIKSLFKTGAEDVTKLNPQHAGSDDAASVQNGTDSMFVLITGYAIHPSY